MITVSSGLYLPSIIVIVIDHIYSDDGGDSFSATLSSKPTTQEWSETVVHYKDVVRDEMVKMLLTGKSIVGSCRFYCVYSCTNTLFLVIVDLKISCMLTLLCPQAAFKHLCVI